MWRNSCEALSLEWVLGKVSASFHLLMYFYSFRFCKVFCDLRQWFESASSSLKVLYSYLENFFLFLFKDLFRLNAKICEGILSKIFLPIEFLKRFMLRIMFPSEFIGIFFNFLNFVPLKARTCSCFLLLQGLIFIDLLQL